MGTMALHADVVRARIRAQLVCVAAHCSPVCGQGRRLATHVTALDAAQEERCTALHGVPTMFAAELDHPRFDEFDLSTLRTGVMAGAPCPISLMKRVVEKMHLSEITIAYGMTETGPVSCQSTIDTPLHKRGLTVGNGHDHQ